MIDDRDCYPPSNIPGDCIPISECWSKMSEHDPSLYELDAQTISPLENWLAQTAEHKIGEAIKDGSLRVYRNDGRRINHRIFAREDVYLDRSIKGGALRTIPRDDREGAYLFVSSAEFSTWLRRTAAKNATISTAGAVHRATDWLADLMRAHPDRHPTGKNRDEIVAEIAAKFERVSITAARSQVWKDAIAKVPECLWSNRGRRKSVGS